MKTKIIFAAICGIITITAGAQSASAGTNGSTVVTSTGGTSNTTVNTSSDGESYSYSYSTSSGKNSCNSTVIHSEGSSKKRHKASDNSVVYASGNFECDGKADFDKFREKVESRLIADNIIKKGENYSFALSKNKFSVNGKTMDDAKYQECVKIYEETFGKKFGNDTSFAYSMNH